MSSEQSQFTGLILLSGVDTPGITQALFETLSPFAITVLDIEQVVARDRVILTVLIALNPDHQEAIDEDLNLCAEKLGVDIATSFQSQAGSSIAAKTGLMHVVALGNPLAPAAIAAIAAEIAEHGGNIERIHRTASVPVTAIEFVVSEVDQNCLEVKRFCSSQSLSSSNAIDCTHTSHSKWVAVKGSEVSHLVIGYKVHVLLLATKCCKWKSTTD
jgi:phosphoserine phosphatase